MDESFSLSALTVPELQQELKRRGLKKSGVKAKLIQRLTEYIERYGLEYTGPAEKVPPAVVENVEKSVVAIHNPHPYMEEYEESLIQGVENENSEQVTDSVDNFFPTKPKEIHIEQEDEEKEVNRDDVITPDSDAPIPFPAGNKVEFEEQVGSPTYPASTGKITERDARDEAEELTEPIHKSPTYGSEVNGRIVELPDKNEVGEEEEEEEGEEEEVQKRHDDEDVDMEKEGEGEQCEQNGDAEEHDAASGELCDDVNGALHNEGQAEEEEEEEVEKHDEGMDDNRRGREQVEEVEEDEVDYEEDREEEEEARPIDGEEEDQEKEEGEEEVVEDKEEGEVSIEDGEIEVNVEENNGFGDEGDDHLDVSVHEEKISDDHEMDEDTEEEVAVPKPPVVKKVVVPVTLKKRISLTASAETSEERAARRKRRWGSTTTADVAISSESIKKLLPDIKIDAAAIESVPELDYQEDDNENAQEDGGAEDDADLDSSASAPKIFKGSRNVKVDSGKKITLDKPASTNTEIVDVESESDAVATPTTPAPVVKPPVSKQRSYIDDEVEVTESREKSLSPAHNPVALYILIKNLVRPFTVNQLKAVISRTGKIQDGGFWINNIKTHCYVKLSTEEEAAATRDALHGLRWPASSPKLLEIDFAINEEMYRETTGLLGQKPKVVIEIEDKDSDVQITDDRRSNWKSGDAKEAEKKKRKGAPAKEEKTTAVKESAKNDKKDPDREESPAKLLDDLFRKTKATPCIYWLPLTDEQILKMEESKR